MALLEIENLHSYYGHVHALKGISLEVEDGEILAMSKGLHLWEYSWEWASCRLRRDDAGAA